MTLISGSSEAGTRTAKRMLERDEEVPSKRARLPENSKRLKQITETMITSYHDSFHTDDRNKLARNAVSQVGLPKLLIERPLYKKVSHLYSDVVGDKVLVSDQRSSGRCWIFAGLNVMRIPFKKKYKLDYFQFSANYLFFWDSFEKVNYFLNSIIKFREKPLDDRVNREIIQNGIYDGGNWDWFVNLVNKYGVIPKTDMPESHSSSHSSRMKSTLDTKVREFAKKLRERHDEGATREELRKEKNTMLNEVYKILAICLGEPPESIDWQYVDTRKRVRTLERLTPKEFMKEHVPYDPSEKILISNYPVDGKPFNKLYYVEGSSNMWESKPAPFLNLPANDLRWYVIDMIRERKEAVWFSADIGKDSEMRDSAIMDPDLYNYELVFGFKKELSKGERLVYQDTYPNHAMVISGVDMRHDDDDVEYPLKWRVENSWGKSSGKDGFLCMMDKWFEEHVFEVVIDRSLLLKKHRKIIDKGQAIKISRWDAIAQRIRK